MKEKFVKWVAGDWIPHIIEEDVKRAPAKKRTGHAYVPKKYHGITRNEKVIKELQEEYGDIEYHAIVI